MHGGRGRRREVLRNEWNAWWEPVELGRRRDVEKASCPLAGLGAEFSESVITMTLIYNVFRDPNPLLGR
jgi:hypothetical protein